MQITFTQHTKKGGFVYEKCNGWEEIAFQPMPTVILGLKLAVEYVDALAWL